MTLDLLALVLHTAAELSLSRLDCGFGFDVSTTGGMIARSSSHYWSLERQAA